VSDGRTALEEALRAPSPFAPAAHCDERGRGRALAAALVGRPEGPSLRGLRRRRPLPDRLVPLPRRKAVLPAAVSAVAHRRRRCSHVSLLKRRRRFTASGGHAFDLIRPPRAHRKNRRPVGEDGCGLTSLRLCRIEGPPRVECAAPSLARKKKRTPPLRSPPAFRDSPRSVMAPNGTRRPWSQARAPGVRVRPHRRGRRRACGSALLRAASRERASPACRTDTNGGRKDHRTGFLEPPSGLSLLRRADGARPVAYGGACGHRRLRLFAGARQPRPVGATAFQGCTSLLLRSRRAPRDRLGPTGSG